MRIIQNSPESSGEVELCLGLLSPARRERVEEGVYLLAAFFFALYSWIMLTNFETLFGIDAELVGKVFEAIAGVCIIAKLLLQRYGLRRLVLVVVCGLVMVASALTSGDHVLLWLFLFVVAARGVKLKPVAVVMLLAIVVIFVPTVLSAATGLIPSRMAKGVMAEGTRISLGFTHPNVLCFSILSMCVFWSVLRWERIGWRDLLGMSVLAVFAGVVTMSRTGVASFVLLFVLIGIGRLQARGPKHGRTWGHVGNVLAAIATAVVALSFVLMVVYDSSVPAFAALNKILATRLSLMHSYFGTYPLTLLGHNYDGAPAVDYTALGNPITFLVDNAYCHIALQSGIIATLIFLLGYLGTMWKAARRRYLSVVLLGLFLFAVIGFTETYIIKLQMNIFLIAICPFVFGDDLSALEGAESILVRFAGYRRITGCERHQENV